MNPGILLSYPGKNQNVLKDLLALQRADMLALFCTTIAWRPEGALNGIVPAGIRGQLERRVFEGVDPRLIRAFPAREWVRQVALRLGLRALTRHERGWASFDAVAYGLDARVSALVRGGQTRAAAIYGYECSSLASFAAAAGAGMRRFYELTTGYWRAAARILGEESERNPEWAVTMEGLQDSAVKKARKDAELGNADHVFVPSSFVRTTLGEHPSLTASVEVMPYGAPPPNPRALMARGRAPALRLLYVGNLTQQKGLSYLFDAMRSLGNAATLTLIGQKPTPHCAALEDALGRYEWMGVLSHAEVLEVMARHDLLVLPTLFDGFGLVILEAMAQGLPVIATPNSGAPDTIEEGKDGFI
ncbi:MAG TPA: glycosyltransferase family 4 protein, partial [Stellaceae bacterium]|nr:glycosyltransferase family 4 protein [Stellaceae bacterium]